MMRLASLTACEADREQKKLASSICLSSSLSLRAWVMLVFVEKTSFGWVVIMEKRRWSGVITRIENSVETDGIGGIE